MRKIILLGVALGVLAVPLLIASRRDPAPVVVADASIRADPVNLDARVSSVPPLAFDAPDRTARDEREALVAAIRESGVAIEVWDDQARALFASISRAESADIGCFVAGCASTFTFRSEAEAAASISATENSDAYRVWTGGKRFSQRELRADHRVVVALVLYRPD